MSHQKVSYSKGSPGLHVSGGDGKPGRLIRISPTAVVLIGSQKTPISLSALLRGPLHGATLRAEVGINEVETQVPGTRDQTVRQPHINYLHVMPNGMA